MQNEERNPLNSNSVKLKILRSTVSDETWAIICEALGLNDPSNIVNEIEVDSSFTDSTKMVGYETAFEYNSAAKSVKIYKENRMDVAVANAISSNGKPILSEHEYAGIIMNAFHLLLMRIKEHSTPASIEISLDDPDHDIVLKINDENDHEVLFSSLDKDKMETSTPKEFY